MAVSRLLKPCATPPASWPMALDFLRLGQLQLDLLLLGHVDQIGDEAVAAAGQIKVGASARAHGPGAPRPGRCGDRHAGRSLDPGSRARSGRPRRRALVAPRPLMVRKVSLTPADGALPADPRHAAWRRRRARRRRRRSATRAAGRAQVLGGQGDRRLGSRLPDGEPGRRAGDGFDQPHQEPAGTDRAGSGPGAGSRRRAGRRWTASPSARGGDSGEQAAGSGPLISATAAIAGLRRCPRRGWR